MQLTKANPKQGVSESSRSTELRRLMGVTSSSQLTVEKVMFYATSRGSKADDGKEGSGGECMPRHQCLSAEYVCSPVVSKLSVYDVTWLRKHDYGVYSFLNISGFFTGCLHKFLQQPNAELGAVITSVKRAVRKFFKEAQKPVREFN